jgi:hypothetical protein
LGGEDKKKKLKKKLTGYFPILSQICKMQHKTPLTRKNSFTGLYENFKIEIKKTKKRKDS